MTTTGVEGAVTERRARWERFLRMDGKQAFMHLIAWESWGTERPWPTAENRQARIEWAWQVYERRLGLLGTLDDDGLPFLDPYTGTEIFAQAFGCRVVYPLDNMPFALPLIDKPMEVSRVQVPDLDSPSLALLFDIADELRRRAGPGALMRLIDVQSPMDIAALIWNKNTFYAAMLDAPEAVIELAHKVKKLLVLFLDAWFSRYGSSFIAHYPDYYMPAGLTLSEDEVGAVSPQMFERFFLPELAELSNRYGALGMHCCASARHQWQGFLKIPNLKVLNICQPAGVVAQAHRFFAAICAQQHLPPESWDVSQVTPSQFPSGAHVVLTSAVKSQEDALRCSAAFHRAFR
ncbi:MAG TPA: uroporphyrinogen decarboxylase family protein [Spirochaetia bacterium]|nr:uroporphyrinogen decarboxylase family protein [Spirochaetia bacterium]